MAGRNLVGVGAGDSPLVLGCSSRSVTTRQRLVGQELVRCEAQPAKRMTTVARLDHATACYVMR